MNRTGGNQVRVAGGFSVVETLIASLILLFIALGIIPIFARAIRDNSSGSDSSQATNHARSRIEEALQLPFNNQALAVTGAATAAQTVDFWDQGSPDRVGETAERWVTTRPSLTRALWTRTLQVRQFGIADLDDGRLDTPLPGSTQPVFVHLKEVEVRLVSEKQPGNPLATAGGQLVFRSLKPF